MLSIARLSALLLAIPLAGCQSYNPYGYGGYPSTYGPAPSPYGSPYGAPGAVPQGAVPGYPTTVPASPGYYPSNGSSPSMTPVPNQSYNNDAPAFNSGAAAGGGKLVPEYSDPATLGKPEEFGDPADFNANPSTGFNEPKGTPARQVAFAENALGETAPADSGATASGATASGATVNAAADSASAEIAATDNAFEDPAPFQPVSFETDAAGESDAPQPNPYAHDAQNFRWFRGVVDFDEEEQAWFLVYNPEPDGSDKFGGVISLLHHPQLNVLRRNDVVLVEGGFSPDKQDRFGKPKFAVQHAAQLKAKGE